MSVLLIPPANSQLRSTAGFTLLELLTVLFVVGLAASFILPNLPKVFDRLSYALDRDSVIRSLNQLPYIAADTNRDHVLFGELTDGSRSNDSDVYISSGEVGISGPFRNGSMTRALPELPANWRLSIPEPIIFRSSGFCSGGRVTVHIGSDEYDLVAQAPLCQFKEPDS